MDINIRGVGYAGVSNTQKIEDMTPNDSGICSIDIL